VWSAALSPDGSRIVAASGDKTARIWDARLQTMSVKGLLAEACARLAGLSKLTRDEMRLAGYLVNMPEIDVCSEPGAPSQPILRSSSAPPGRPIVRSDPAIENLDQAIAANPNDARAFERRGEFYVLRGNFPAAIADFDEVLRLRPKDPEALGNRCWARALLGDLQTALLDCNEALQIRPRYADAYDSRGLVNLKIGEANNAIADYDAALRINPKQASSLYGRGMAKLKIGNSADAMLDIAAAKALQANIAEEFANLGIR
jgi:tetratricopeptide (TPR) repeat protein